MTTYATPKIFTDTPKIETSQTEIDITADTFAEAKAYAERLANHFHLTIVKAVDISKTYTNCPVFTFSGPTQTIKTLEAWWDDGGVEADINLT